MNDFSELEGELKKLRPHAVSPELIPRVEVVLARHPERSGAQRNEVEGSRGATLKLLPLDTSTASLAPLGMTGETARARRLPQWWPVGLGLAAAASVLLLARLNVERPASAPQAFAAVTPKAAPADGSFLPAGLTQVVYHTRDEGLQFPAGADRPIRRTRARKRETLQWRNAETGASLRVSYPSEEVTLTPISGQ